MVYTQVLNRLFIGDTAETHKKVIVDAVVQTLKSAYPRLSTTVGDNSINKLYVKFMSLDNNPTISSRRLLGSERTAADYYSQYELQRSRQLGACDWNGAQNTDCACCKVSDADPGCALNCYVGVSYKVNMAAEVIGSSTPELARLSILNTINAASTDLSFQLYMKASSYNTNGRFDYAESQYAATAGPVVEVVYKRSSFPTFAPTPIPGPTPEPIVATKGTGLILIVCFLGFLGIVVGGYSAYWAKQVAERKVKEARRLAQLDKWNKLPRNVNKDKDPDFLDIYGGYAGGRGKDDPESGHDDQGGDSYSEWQKKQNDGGRPYWINKSTQKTTFRKPLSRTPKRGGTQERDNEKADFDFGGASFGDDAEEKREREAEADDRAAADGSGAAQDRKSRRDQNVPKLLKGLSVPVRVRQTLDFQGSYNNDAAPAKGVNSSMEFFRPPLNLTRDKVKESALVPDKNLWFERYSKRYGKVFWKHQVTNEISWKPPHELDYYKDKEKQAATPILGGGSPAKPKSKRQDQPSQQFFSPAQPGSQQQQQGQGLAEVWAKKDSRKYGLPYWQHADTGEVRWEDPAGRAEPTAGAYMPPSSGAVGAANAETDHPPPTKREVWIEKVSTEHGLNYYKSATSGTILWEPPVGDHVEIVDYREHKARQRGGGGGAGFMSPKVKTQLDV